MFQHRIVLAQMRQGASEREIARSHYIGRNKLAVLRAMAQRRCSQRSTSPPVRRSAPLQQRIPAFPAPSTPLCWPCRAGMHLAMGNYGTHKTPAIKAAIKAAIKNGFARHTSVHATLRTPRHASLHADPQKAVRIPRLRTTSLGGFP